MHLTRKIDCHYEVGHFNVFYVESTTKHRRHFERIDLARGEFLTAASHGCHKVREQVVNLAVISGQ